MIRMAHVYLDNPYPDYDESEPTLFLDGLHIKKELIDSATNLTNELFSKIFKNVKHYSQQSDYSVYTGYCGIALLHMWNYKRTKDKESLECAEQLIDLAVRHSRGRRLSFLNGDAGPLALGAVLKVWACKEKEADALIHGLVTLPNTVAELQNEILYGYAGYLYALFFVVENIGRVIPIEHIRHHMQALLRSGYKRAKRENFECPLKYEWHDKNYLGAAHGVAGILYVLLVNKDLLTEFELNSLIKPTLDWLISKRFSSGNFPSSETNDRDKLVQWCHGAPGFVHLFIVAFKVYGDDDYLKVALKCGDVVWNRGIIAKGYSLCHGVSGNAYTFAHLYKATKDKKHLHRLSCFIHWCTSYPKNEGLKPDRPYSLYEGIAGLIYFLSDMQEVEKSTFPGYEL